MYIYIYTHYIYIERETYVYIYIYIYIHIHTYICIHTYTCAYLISKPISHPPKPGSFFSLSTLSSSSWISYNVTWYSIV